MQLGIIMRDYTRSGMIYRARELEMAGSLYRGETSVTASAALAQARTCVRARAARLA